MKLTQRYLVVMTDPPL